MYEVQYVFGYRDGQYTLRGSRHRKLRRWWWPSRWVETGDCSGPTHSIEVPEISPAAIGKAFREVYPNGINRD